MATLAERVAAIAQEARAKAQSVDVAREWWLVTKPEGVVEVFCCPPRTQSQMLAMYPGCGVMERAA